MEVWGRCQVLKTDLIWMTGFHCVFLLYPFAKIVLLQRITFGLFTARAQDSILVCRDAVSTRYLRRAFVSHNCS